MKTAPINRAIAGRPLFGVRILVVDSSPDLQRLFALHLDRAGADFLLVDDCETALRFYLEGDRPASFDAILLDMDSSRMEGWIAIQRLRQTEFVGPILAMTDAPDRYEFSECVAYGADRLVVKPFSFPELPVLILECLATRESTADQPPTG